MPDNSAIDDGLDARYELAAPAPRLRSFPAARTLVRGALYGAMLAVMFGIGLLAMIPGDSPLGKWLDPRPDVRSSQHGGQCSHFEIDIPRDHSTIGHLAGEQ